MILYCLPYAGGAANLIYSKWGKCLDERIKVVPLDLAGHGTRIREKFNESIEEAVLDLFEKIESGISNERYAFYGHSMGAVLAYELTSLIQEKNLNLPETLFLSGRKPINTVTLEESKFDSPEDVFIKSIMDLGGTPQGFFDNGEMRKIYLPIIRNDYYLLWKYRRFEKEGICVDTDIMAFAGQMDNLANIEQMNDWRNYFSGDFESYEYSGGHFFINDHYSEICDHINYRLLGVTSYEKKLSVFH